MEFSLSPAEVCATVRQQFLWSTPPVNETPKSEEEGIYIHRVQKLFVYCPRCEALEVGTPAHLHTFADLH